MKLKISKIEYKLFINKRNKKLKVSRRYKLQHIKIIERFTVHNCNPVKATLHVTNNETTMAGCKPSSHILDLTEEKYKVGPYDEDLIEVDPYDPTLDNIMKQKIITECKNNYWYFINTICRIPSPVQPEVVPYYIDKIPVVDVVDIELFRLQVAAFTAIPQQLLETPIKIDITRIRSNDRYGFTSRSVIVPDPKLRDELDTEFSIGGSAEFIKKIDMVININETATNMARAGKMAAEYILAKTRLNNGEIHMNIGDLPFLYPNVSGKSRNSFGESFIGKKLTPCADEVFFPSDHLKEDLIYQEEKLNAKKHK